MRSRPAFALILVLWTAACQRPAAPAVTLDKDGVAAAGVDGRALAVLKASPEGADAWTRALTVSVGPGLPPVTGRYAVDGRTLRFTPDLPLEPGQTYLARLDPGAGRAPIIVRLTPAADRAAPARVLAVYPSGDVVPQNLLRLYLQFSAPMAAGRQGRLQLLDGEGGAVEDPFLPLGYEFWSPDRTRLTLLVDPGRVKRGVLPGAVLKQGGRYTLVVGEGWLDARGRPLASQYRRTFSAGPPERRALDPLAWSIAAPRAGSREPLKVAFGRPLDRALLLSAMGVDAQGGQALEGRVDTDPGETGWSFTPIRPWTDNAYRLMVRPWLEDPAGNRPGRPFEQTSRAAAPKGLIAVPFRPRP